MSRQSYVESRDASILVHSCYPEGEMDEEMDEILSTKSPTEVRIYLSLARNRFIDLWLTVLRT